MLGNDSTNEYTIGARWTPAGMALWIGSIGPRQAAGADTLVIETAQGARPTKEQPREVDGGEGTLVRCWQVAYDPSAAETVRLRVNGVCRGEARVGPLRVELDRPLRVLLGSCFHVDSQGAGRLSKAIEALSPAYPDLQFLCGDQVYLDRSGLRQRLCRSELADRSRVIDMYRRTWWREGGLSKLLQAAPSVFCPDDHDVWNEYRKDVVVDSRRAWHGLALELLDAVQTPERWQAFDVSPLSFLVLDTRRERTGSEFMSQHHLDRAVDWLAQLKGPGVLVTGQPLFGEPWRPWRVRLGSDLSEFRSQYAQLAAAVSAAPHSVVLLSGDVHWGRVASATEAGQSTVRVAEVISSPLALHSRLSRLPRDWVKAPCRFPHGRLSAGARRLRTKTDCNYKVRAEHFAIIEFERQGEQVVMRVTAHPTDGSGCGNATSLMLR